MYTTTEARIKFNYGRGCGGLDYDWEGRFKVEAEGGCILYFFYSTVEGGTFGVTRDNLFEVANVAEEGPDWMEFYMMGIEMEGFEESKYYKLFKNFEKYVRALPTEVKAEGL